MVNFIERLFNEKPKIIDSIYLSIGTLVLYGNINRIFYKKMAFFRV